LCLFQQNYLKKLSGSVLILSEKRFAKSFYSKTALQAVLCLFQQNYLKKLSGSVIGTNKKGDV